METQTLPDVARRRLRRKTAVGHVAVALVAAMHAAPAVAEAVWSERFLDDEDLAQEEAVARKATYLVTQALPNPDLLAFQNPDLQALPNPDLQVRSTPELDACPRTYRRPPNPNLLTVQNPGLQALPNPDLQVRSTPELDACPTRDLQVPARPNSPA